MRTITACLIGMAFGLAVARVPPAARAVTAITTVLVSRDRYGAHLEPSLALHPRNPRNLLGTAYVTPDAHDMNQGRLPATFASFDGGASWHDNGPLTLPAGYSSGSNVVVAFSADGIGIIVARADNGPGHTGIVAWRTADGRRHVLPPVVLATGSAPDSNLDHPGIAVAPPGAVAAGAVYVVWSVTTSRRSDIALTRSVDGGRRFAAPRLITGPELQGDVAPIVMAGPHGRVAVVYGDAGAAGASAENGASFQRIPLKIVQSVDGGQHFARPRELGVAQMGALTARPLPWFGQAAVATDPRDGTLYVAFPQARRAPTDRPVALAR